MAARTPQAPGNLIDLEKVFVRLRHEPAARNRVEPPQDGTRRVSNRDIHQPLSVIHYDLYRMSSPEEFLDAGFREDFDGHIVCIVEWPEKGEPVLPPPDIRLLLSVSGNGRAVELQALSELGLLCLDRLAFLPPPQ